MPQFHPMQSLFNDTGKDGYPGPGNKGTALQLTNPFFRSGGFYALPFFKVTRSVL